MAAASSEPSAQGPARRLGLLYSALACLVVFVGAAWWSWHYAPLPDPFEPAESRTLWQWLTTPIEENAFRRLPVITGDLNGVFALKGTEHVWVVGQGGMILHSADGGESWEQQSDIDWSPTAPKETEPPAQSDAFGLIRSAQAGEQPRYIIVGEIYEVQQQLRDLGYDPGPLDNRPGGKTRAAIEQFQRDGGLPVDGEVTPALRERLAKSLDSRRTNLPVSPPPDGNPGPGPGPTSGPGPGPSSGPGPLAPNPNPNLGPGSLATPTPSPALVALNAVAFADERLGVAVGDNGLVLRTTDGGQHWQAVTSGTTAALSSVAFADAERALAVGDGGTVLLSTDAGERWQTKTSGTERSLRSVAFADAERALAVGDVGTVLLSTDGGERWEARTSDTEAGLLSVAFGGGHRAVTVGKDGTVLLSTDDGERWQPKESGTKQRLSSVAFADAERALAVADVGTVLLSTDRGESWQPKTSGTKAWLLSVAFADGHRAVAVGSYGTVLRSADGGESWEARTNGTETSLQSVAFAKPGRAIAVGDGGTVLVSGNVVENLGPRTSGTEQLLYSVIFANTERALAVGEGGWVLLSRDGGETWQRKTSGTKAWLFAVASANAEQVVAVGEQGTVLVSIDGGERWQPKTSGTTAGLSSVAFADAKRALAVGDGGTVLLSTDAGERWQTKRSGTDESLRSVAFANAKRALAVGMGGTVLLSTDGGENWQPKKSGTKARLLSVAFADAKRALAVGDGGTVLLSTDEGENWQPTAIGTAASLESVVFADAEGAVAVGEGGTVLVSIDGGESWRPVEYRRYPAPLFLALSGAALMFGLVGVRRAWREVPVERRTVSVTDLFASDRPLRPGERDALDLGAIARGISRFLRNRQTEPPLTIAVTGEWGSGKSSLMGLLYEDLRGRGFRPVWFNAWHHQRGEHLLASLYANIRAQALPPAWTPEGLGFRWDLFWIRARRHWLWLILTVLLVSLVFGYFWFHPASGRWLIALVPKDPKDLWEEIGKTTLLGGGLLAALAPPLVGLYNAVRAFGLEPNRLLGSLAVDAGGAVKAEPGVRYRFAAEFADVTKALKPQTLVIFIDDLDRCTQEHVLEVLECINFLVTAGDCYIVLGMSRRWVETCVGLAFKELAAEAPDEAGGSNDTTAVPVPPGQQASPSLLQADDPRDERRRFARQYLEKLVNIEVPIPRVGDAAAASLLAPPLRADPTRRVRAARWLRAKATEWGLLLLLVAIAAGAGWVATTLPEIGTEETQTGYDLRLMSVAAADGLVKEGRNLVIVALVGTDLHIRIFDASGKKVVDKAENELVSGETLTALKKQLTPIPDEPGLSKEHKQKIIGDATSIAGHTPQTSSVSDKPKPSSEKPPDEGSAVQPPEPLPTEDRVAFSPGARDEGAPLYHWGSAGVAALALVILIGVLLGRRGRVQTEDSEDFHAALEVMRPWIVLGHPTPRLLKRYLNHVRFVAMRQRGDEEPESLVGSLLGRLGLVPKPPEPLAPPAGLAEPVLVALSALHQSRLDWQIEPEWLLDDYANLKDGGISALVNTRLEDTAGRAELLAKLKKALDDYNKRFPANCLFADEQRDRHAIWTLLEAMAGVRIDGKVEAPVTATPVGEPAAAAPA